MGEWRGYWEISEVKKCHMLSMPLTLADTLTLWSPKHEQLSAAMGPLSADWWGWGGGGFPLESPSLPLQDDTRCPPHAPIFTVLLLLLPGS